MIEYEPQLEYPKNYPTINPDSTFDVNDRDSVRDVIHEVFPKILGDAPADAEIKITGIILEVMLEEELPLMPPVEQSKTCREQVIQYLIENFPRAKRTFNKIYRGLQNLRRQGDS